MRVPWRFVLALCLAMTSTIKAELSREALLSLLPSCTMDCLVSFTNSPCLPSNKTCTCTNDDYRDHMSQCIIMNCTVKESLATKNLTSSYCNAPVRDISTEHIIMSNVIGSMGILCIVQRILLKSWWGLRIEPDDWVILATGVSSVPALLLNQYGVTANGLGRDIWTLQFDQITRFAISFYVLIVNYFGQVALLKLALLLFYLRIFPSPKTRKILWVTMALNVTSGVSFMLIAAFQCAPISYFWHRWDGEHQGHCQKINTIAWANAALSIAFDIWMIFIPLWHLRNLNLDAKKKFGIGLMFSVGTFVTVVSIVRLRSLVQFGETRNSTWDYLPITRWSVIEIAVGQICACMPSIRVALLRLFPRLQDPSTNPEESRAHGVTVLNLAFFGKNRVVTNLSRVETGIATRRPFSTGIVCERTFDIRIDVNDEEAELVRERDPDTKSHMSDLTY